MKASPWWKFRLRTAAVSLAGLAAAVLAASQVPHRWCMREGARWFDGDPALQDRLARGVEKTVLDDLKPEAFHTGSSQFNGEWLFGTYLMAGLGYGQLALQRPEWRARAPALMQRCIEQIMTPGVRAFDRAMWKDEDPLDTLDTGGDHAAFLGYFNLLLGLHRLLDPQSPFAELHDRISARLLHRLEESKWLLLESYPNEIYPVDNCAVLGGLGLHEQATGRPRSQVLARALANLRANYRDAQSGLLFQAVAVQTGKPVDDPRGSGTTLGLYFLSYADPALARDLNHSVEKNLSRTFLGFGAVREYPEWITEGEGDIDSGPIVLGYGVSPTGFHLAGCRIFGQRETFRRLYASAHLAGSPLDRGDRREYVTGGPLGNAILFAMFTAIPDAIEPIRKPNAALAEAIFAASKTRTREVCLDDTCPRPQRSWPRRSPRFPRKCGGALRCTALRDKARAHPARLLVARLVQRARRSHQRVIRFPDRLLWP